jgi:hypothetical protein
MPNHYHFSLEILHALQFQKEFRSFLISYAKAINSEYGRYGHLFQGRFHAELIDSDAYFLSVSRYIHLNPVAAKLVLKPEDWEFSSYKSYLNGLSIWTNPSGKSLKIETRFTLSVADGLEGYKRFVNSTVGGDSL